MKIFNIDVDITQTQLTISLIVISIIILTYKYTVASTVVVITDCDKDITPAKHTLSTIPTTETLRKGYSGPIGNATLEDNVSSVEMGGIVLESSYPEPLFEMVEDRPVIMDSNLADKIKK